jgi:hypothetical protein
MAAERFVWCLPKIVRMNCGIGLQVLLAASISPVTGGLVYGGKEERSSKGTDPGVLTRVIPGSAMVAVGLRRKKEEGA